VVDIETVSLLVDWASGMYERHNLMRKLHFLQPCHVHPARRSQAQTGGRLEPAVDWLKPAVDWLKPEDERLRPAVRWLKPEVR
jgi:hypothetical protein